MRKFIFMSLVLVLVVGSIGFSSSFKSGEVDGVEVGGNVSWSTSNVWRDRSDADTFSAESADHMKTTAFLYYGSGNREDDYQSDHDVSSLSASATKWTTSSYAAVGLHDVRIYVGGNWWKENTTDD